ncbi:MAG TPA: hypothetical protein VNX01_15955 [Bacteroidia bacterium]|jgi:hypothetical protein|nr:hypothetical protein [Bacteroidia bacterium]
MVRVILVALTLIMVACTKSPTQPQMANPKFADNYIAPLAKKASLMAEYNKRTLLQFKQSNSNTSSSLPHKILHKALQSDVLIVKIRSTQNCYAQYKGDFNFTDNHLNLSLQQQPRIVKRKNGQTDTIYSSYESNCVYEFTYTISNIHALPQTITLNGKVIN